MSLLPCGHLSHINNVPGCKLEFARLHYFPHSWQMFALMQLTAVGFLIKVQVNQRYSSNFDRCVETLLHKDF